MDIYFAAARFHLSVHSLEASEYNEHIEGFN